MRILLLHSQEFVKHFRLGFLVLFGLVEKLNVPIHQRGGDVHLSPLNRVPGNPQHPEEQGCDEPVLLDDRKSVSNHFGPRVVLLVRLVVHGKKKTGRPVKANPS